MAGKGGSDTLDSVGSFLGNALIPETMARFRAANELPRQRAAVSSLLDSSGMTAADPTATTAQRPSIASQVFRDIAPDTDATKYNAIESLRAGAPGFDPAFLTSKITQMFAPTPTGKDRFVDTPNGVFDVVTKKMVDGTGKPNEPGSQVGKAALDLKNGLITKDEYNRIVAKETQGTAKAKWRTLSPQESAALNLVPGGTYQVDDNSGQIQVITQPSKDMGPGAIKLAAVRSATKPLLDSLDDFEKEVDKSDFWGRANAATGGTSAAGKALTTSWTNAAMQAKGEALYNLGVLSGPDLQMIQGALTNPSSLTGAASSKDAYKTGIRKIRDLVKSRLAAAEQSYSSEGLRSQTPPPPAQFKVYENPPAPGATGKWSITKVN